MQPDDQPPDTPPGDPGPWPEPTRRRPIPDVSGVPAHVRVNLGRSRRVMIAKVERTADRYGTVMVTAYRRSGLRRLYDIRDGLSDAYSGEVEPNDPERHPDRYHGQLHVLWVHRSGGPIPVVEYGDPQQRAVDSLAYWQQQHTTTDQPEQPPTDQPNP